MLEMCIDSHALRRDVRGQLVMMSCFGQVEAYLENASFATARGLDAAVGIPWPGGGAEAVRGGRAAL